MCKCKMCKEEILLINTKNFPKEYCSYRCYEDWRKFNTKPNCKCEICGLKMYMKPYRLKRLKNGITCSLVCANSLKKITFKGENNHQYGLKGKLNKSFKGDIVTKQNHKLIEYLVYKPDHPFVRSDNRVLLHRLIVEENFELFDKIFFVNIDGVCYLKPEYDVHHIDENHNNNEITNLKILNRSEHSLEHTKDKKILRNELGQIIGVVKSTKNGES